MRNQLLQDGILSLFEPLRVTSSPGASSEKVSTSLSQQRTLLSQNKERDTFPI